jgi:NADH dehydrogenase [ubiquinone] 1 alpha subcomplex assembly factor 5
MYRRLHLLQSLRSYLAFRTKRRAFSTGDAQQPDVFDRHLKHRQRNQSLLLPESEYYDYLRDEVSIRLVDRLDDITRKFPLVLNIGCHRGQFLASLLKESKDREEVCGGVQTLVNTDSSEQACLEAEKRALQQSRVLVHTIVSDEEYLPFRENSFDLAVSSLVLHWCNNLESTLLQACEVLKPDGCFLGAMLGGSTLKEFRYCMYLAEQERKGGFSPHTSPFASPSDVSSLLQGAGFQLQTVDVDTVTVGYPDMPTLMTHLQRMGESSAALNRHLSVGKDVFLAASSIYQKLYGLEDGSIPVTFQIIYMIGWKHHENQPRPKRRGSASKSLKDINKSDKKVV